MEGGSAYYAHDGYCSKVKFKLTLQRPGKQGVQWSMSKETKAKIVR